MPRPFDRAAAAPAVAALRLNAINRELADYWLSQWREGKLPARGAINPSHLAKFLPGLAIVEIHPDQSVRYRIAGAAFRAGYGFDPSGRDLMALTAPDQRAARLRRFQSFVAGTVGSTLRAIKRADEPDTISQDLVLPLGGRSEDGARPWLFHSSWRPARSDWPHTPAPATVGMVDGYELRALA